MSKGTLHSVGAGTASDPDDPTTFVRKNAWEIMQDGKAFLLGAGGYDGTNSDAASGVTDVATLLNNAANATLNECYSQWTIIRDGIDVTSQVDQPQYIPQSGQWTAVVIDGDPSPYANPTDSKNATYLMWFSADMGSATDHAYVAFRSVTSGYQLGDDDQHILAPMNALAGITMPSNPTQRELIETVIAILNRFGGTVTP